MYRFFINPSRYLTSSKYAISIAAVRLVSGIGITTSISCSGHSLSKNVEEICKEINADQLIYQNLDDLIWAVQQGNLRLDKFDTSVFDGNYITGVEEGYFENLETLRNDKSKQEREKEYVGIDLQNSA